MLVKTRRQGTMTGRKSRPIRRGTEVDRCRAGLTNAVQPVDGDSLEGAAHHGVLLQHLIEMVDGEGEESAVRVGTNTGCTPPFGQQADLCRVAEGKGWGGKPVNLRISHSVLMGNKESSSSISFVLA